MRLEIDVPAKAIRDVCIPLGGSEVGMAQHLLHGAEVGAALEEVRGERVPEEVRMDSRRLEPGAVGELAQDEERAGSRERRRGRSGELGPVAAIEVRTAEREIAAHGFRGRAAQRHEPLLPALAEHANDAPRLRRRSSRGPQPRRRAGGSVEQFDQRAV
jgi:hypothetical protein